MDRTRGRGLRPRPPCGVNKIGIYGHGVGIFLFDPGGPNISSLPLFFGEFGPLATTLKLSNTLVLWSLASGSPRKNILSVENVVLWSDVRLGPFFENVFSPKGWQKNPPKLWKSQNVKILSIAQWFYPFPQANPMQKTHRCI